jgi:hypothetical protein
VEGGFLINKLTVISLVVMWKIFHVNTPPFVFAISVTVHSDSFALESYI